MINLKSINSELRNFEKFTFYETNKFGINKSEIHNIYLCCLVLLQVEHHNHIGLPFNAQCIKIFV